MIVDKRIKAANLLIGDKNALLIAARITGLGSDYGVKITCPVCTEQTDCSIDLNDLQIKDLAPSEDYKSLPNGNYEIEFPQYMILRNPEKYFPSGVLGDPEAATPETGNKMNRLVIDELKRLISEMVGK